MQINFNPQAIQVTDRGASIQPPPVTDWYQVEITGEDLKPTNGDKGPGKQLGFSILIQEGQYKGCGCREGMNIENPTESTVRIAQEQLTKFALVVGRYPFRDTTELHKIRFWAKIGQQPGDSRYGELFEIRNMAGADPVTLFNQFRGSPQQPSNFASQQAAPAWGQPPANPFQHFGPPQVPATGFAPSAPAPSFPGATGFQPPPAAPAPFAPPAATASPSDWQQGPAQDKPKWAK